MTRPQVYPSICIGIKRSPDSSIVNFLSGSVISLHICMPILQYWFLLISNLYIQLPNHRPCTKSKMATPQESSVKTLATVYIGTFTCSVYSVNKGDTVPSSEVNKIGHNFDPKQWVSALLSISVTDASQIILYWLLCILFIDWRSFVLILKTSLFHIFSIKENIW